MAAYCCPLKYQDSPFGRLGVLWRMAVSLVQPHIQKREQTVNRERENRTAERLLDTYGNTILRLAYSYLHNLSDAEEILQDTVMKYLQASPAFGSQEHEKAWLLRVAANLSKNRIDYNRLRDTDELSETLAAEQREDLSFLWETVKQLPMPQRAAVHLYYYEGYSTAEIAGLLHRKESSVRSDLRRGREKLKMILREGYDFA